MVSSRPLAVHRHRVLGLRFQFDALVEAFADTGKATGNGRRDYFIATETLEQTSEAQRLAETLRREGKNVEVDLMERDFQAQRDYANQLNYDHLLRLTTDASMYLIHLRTGDTQKITVTDLL